LATAERTTGRGHTNIIGGRLHDEQASHRHGGPRQPGYDTDWDAAATRAIHEIHRVNPGLLVIAGWEGVYRADCVLGGDARIVTGQRPISCAIELGARNFRGAKFFHGENRYFRARLRFGPPPTRSGFTTSGTCKFPISGLSSGPPSSWTIVAPRVLGLSAIAVRPTGDGRRNADSDRQWLEGLVGYLKRDTK